MDYRDILSGIATPDMGRITTVTNHNLSFYFDDFDQDDFPPDDWDSLELHQVEVEEIAIAHILCILRDTFYKIERPNLSDKKVTARPLTRRIVFNDVDAQSNIVENFARITVILDVWINAEEAALEQSYRTLVK